MGQQNIIELNGKRYDAITGVVLGGSTSAIASAPPRSRRAVDGFMRGSKINAPAALRPVPKQPPVTVPGPSASQQAKRMDVSRPADVHHKRHPQKGKTLMRRAVHKPQVSMKPAIRTQAPSEIAPASVTAIAKPLAKKLSVANVDSSRMARAQAAEKSQQIQRFQHIHVPRQTLHTAHVPSAASRPAAFNAIHSAAAPAHISRPVATPASRAQNDIFEAAIARATSHEQRAPRPVRRHSRTAGILAGVGAFLILGGFITYLNMPGLEMQFASMRAGFRAELPEYRPTGYAMAGGIKADAGRISVSFRSGDSQYTVTQQTSNWDSQTLLDNYVATNASNHETIQSQGRTIYLFNGSNATWVDGGVRYEVTGNAPLTADDIVKLATSI